MTLATTLEFHNGNDLQLGFTDYHFGKLNVSVEDCEMPYNTWDVKFSIDCSGSMSDTCKDLKTKMQHIQHTMINILRMFSECETSKFNVSVAAFDDTYDLLFDFQEINATNVEDFIEKIKRIYPKNATNLILPIQQTNTEMQNRKIAFPENKQLHVLLTDGCDTCTSNVYDTLKSFENPDYAFIAFGFGIQHDAKALSIMGEQTNCDYGFIDELEKAGLVYGEYLHAVLYKLFNNITITLENGEIYDWKINTWSDSLSVSSLDSGASKTYYIRTKNTELVEGTIYGYTDSTAEQVILDEFEPVPDLIAFNEDDGTETVETNDLTIHAYRYKTLVLMSEVNEQEESVTMKKKLCDFFDEIKKYIEDNSLQSDLFMKKIQDDIYILKKTYGTRYFEVYSAARQRSQGNQNVCTATQLEEIMTVPYNKLSRSHARWFGDDDTIGEDLEIVNSDNDDDDLEYNISQNIDYERSCSATVSRMMRSISKQ